MEKDYDVIIVGAGPSGCSAAYDLQDYGVRVLLVDKVEFPRVKPCGGGLTDKTIKALRYSVEPVIKKTTKQIVVGSGYNKSTLFKSKNRLCSMTVRKEFDLFCLNKTLEKGAEFGIIDHIESLNETEHGITLVTKNRTYNSRFLIGADGANSRIRKLSGQFPYIKKGLAIEGIINIDKEETHEMEFDFSVNKNGYGWIFPKGDHLNVGLYTSKLKDKITKKSVIEYAKKKLGNDNVHHLVGQQVGLNGHQYIQQSKRIFLVGDAAGLVDPLLAEGIYNAVISGQVAARAIFDEISDKVSAKESYSKGLEALQKDLKTLDTVAFWFYKFPNFGYRLLSFLPTWKFLKNKIKNRKSKSVKLEEVKT